MNEENNKQEIKKESIFKKPWMQSLIAFVLIFGLLTVFLLWEKNKNTVFIENSILSAPIINISTATPGVLNALYVKEGDTVLDNAQIALVGSQILTTGKGGIVSNAPEVIGSYFSPGQIVASVVDNQDMKVVGQVDETGGLQDIKKGERATFTVDAFGSKIFEGQVDEVSPVSNNTGVIFSISDKRAIQKFDVKVIFNVKSYPELRSGMSAKITVHTK